ncbi:MAG TPA: hypothetical protein VGY58_15635 [Gemmataceae bacterium]|nr:hypothetical protein [Gemmataceae bacterium]
MLALKDERAQTLEDTKDRIHEILLDKSELDPRTDCHVWQGACGTTAGGAKVAGQIKVMGTTMNVCRVAAWVYGCEGLPEGWDLFDTSVRVKAICQNRRCVNREHLRGHIGCKRKLRRRAA